MAAIRAKATSVIEVPTGAIQKSQTTLGDQIDVLQEHPIHSEAA
jgi:uncharacterized membrane protein (UPF0127 family)